MKEKTMAHGDEFIEVQALDGTNVKITLANWAEILIERALVKHKLECPIELYKEQRQVGIIELDRRITALELKLKIVHWLMIPFYLGIVGWLVAHFTTLFDKIPKIIP